MEKSTFTEEDFGKLYPFILDDHVTDIVWNGRELWVDNLIEGRYLTDVKLPDDFVERFGALLGNITSTPYNLSNPVLEAELGELRISIIHPSVACTGTSIAIRKSPAVRRLTKDQMVETGYCSEETNSFLRNCMKAKMNIAICGITGSGKTELLKYLTKYIPARERVITIEDNLEIHYSAINPGKDSVELRVNNQTFTYTDALKATLRQLPTWVILSEARSTEVRYLLENFSGGHQGITTLHTDDVRNIPDRIRNMAGSEVDSERVVNDAFNCINVGVLIKKRMIPNEKSKFRIQRYIDQVCIFDRSGVQGKNYRNSTFMVLENGERKFSDLNELPQNFRKKMHDAGIENPFVRKSKERK